MTAHMAISIGRHLSEQSRRLKKILHLPVVHRYSNFTILLPAEHLLPVYQRQHPRYDRFLPHLAAALGADAGIVDVGANCGDTLAGMVECNPGATYVCIEPDAGFSGFLQTNIARMEACLGQLKVHTVQSLVGKSVSEVILAGSGGSRHAVSANGVKGARSSATLDSILAALPPLAVKLLKSDVDGFDFDVIDSARELLQAQHPILFFETQCDCEEQLFGFIRTIASLEALGYHHWAAFDNFGTMVLQTAEPGHIVQLLSYIWKQNQSQATRTIYYLDLLACTAADSALIEAVLRSY